MSSGQASDGGYDPQRLAAAQDLQREMWRVSRRTRHKIGRFSEELGVSVNALMLLESLAHRGPVRQRELCEPLQLDKAALSRLVSELEQRGMIERAPDPDDGRAQLIMLSGQMHERLDTILEARRRRFQERMADWSTQELVEFRAWLHRYNEIWDE